MVSTSPLLVAYEYDLPWVTGSPALPLKLKVPVAIFWVRAVAVATSAVAVAAGPDRVGDGKATGVEKVPGVVEEELGVDALLAVNTASV
jgi:hypothetical protein